MIGLAGMLRGRPPALQVAFAFLLVAEQLNTGSVAWLNRTEETRRIATLSSPPVECKAFAAVVGREGNTPDLSPTLNLYSHNVDSMLASEIFGIPTINGVSTFNPPDWNFNNASTPDYMSRVNAYAVLHRIDGLCGVDFQKLQWISPTEVKIAKAS